MSFANPLLLRLPQQLLPVARSLQNAEEVFPSIRWCGLHGGTPASPIALGVLACAGVERRKEPIDRVFALLPEPVRDLVHVLRDRTLHGFYFVSGDGRQRLDGARCLLRDAAAQRSLLRKHVDVDGRGALPRAPMRRPHEVEALLPHEKHGDAAHVQRIDGAAAD